MAMQLQPAAHVLCPARSGLETRAIVCVHGLSLLVPAGGRCDGMGWDGGRHLATALPSFQIRPGKHRSISRVFPRVSPRPTASPQRGAQDPNTRPYSTCTHPCGSERFCLTALPQFWNSCSPSHTTLQHRYGGHGLALLPPNRPACLPYLHDTCLACVWYLIHPRRSLCHDTTARQPEPVPSRHRCDIETRNIKRRGYKENLLNSQPCRRGGRQFSVSSLSCTAPRPNSNANTTYSYARMCMCPGQPEPSPPPVRLPPFLLRSRMHASPPGKGRCR